jgi:acyl carrier protein
MTEGLVLADATHLEPWLAGRVATYLGRSAEEIDRDSPLADLGMDSVYALSLCGDIEDQLDLQVEPTLAWDHPSIAAIAGYLSSQLAARSVAGK